MKWCKEMSNTKVASSKVAFDIVREPELSKPSFQERKQNWNTGTGLQKVKWELEMWLSIRVALIQKHRKPLGWPCLQKCVVKFLGEI